LCRAGGSRNVCRGCTFVLNAWRDGGTASWPRGRRDGGNDFARDPLIELPIDDFVYEPICWRVRSTVCRCSIVCPLEVVGAKSLVWVLVGDFS